MGASFAWTLRRGSLPLITLMARQVHVAPPPSAAMEAYTRKLTLTWALYFWGMAATSLALFTWGSFAAWSLLANLLTPVSLAVLFVGEYLLRYHWHPEFERVSFHDMVRVARQGRPAAPAPEVAR